MLNTNRIAEVGRLVGEPARAAMLMALMDGRAFTAAELARAANVTPQTASTHLARLIEAGLLQVRKQGRYHYHALAGSDVARLLEDIAELAVMRPASRPQIITGPRDAAMRRARTCYDHFAGRLGVAITDALVQRGALELEEGAARLTDHGHRFLESAGVSLQPAGSKRPLCRTCLDWSERRPHLGGRLGAAICGHFFARRFVVRVDGSRALELTAGGRRELLDTYGIRSV